MTDASKRQSEIVGHPPRIKPLKSGELGAEAQNIATRIRSAAGLPDSAEVPEYVATMLRHPSLYEKHVALGTELLSHGALTVRHRELAILRTGWLCGAPYEWGEHVEIAKRNGLSAADIARLTEGSSAQGWSDMDKAIIQAAEELHADAAISDGTWHRLEAFLDERQLIELPYLIGTYTKVAFLQNALRLRLNPDNQGLSAR